MVTSIRKILFWKICVLGGVVISLAQAESKLWSTLEPVIEARVQQKQPKMKLQLADAAQFKIFLEGLRDPVPKIKALQSILPKTTVELLMAVNKRGLDLKEAEKIAEYLKEVVNTFQFSNAAAFDENTSHIIGREWSEIDYSGENMTWQKQQAKYRPYGIENFKSLECLKKFIPVESRLSYFKKIYRPQNLGVLLPAQ